MDQLGEKQVLMARRALMGMAGALALPACTLPVRLAAVPSGQGGRASVLGLPNERFRLDGDFSVFDAEVQAATIRQRAYLRLPERQELPPVNLLAISGGGEDGAFGAGLLSGWSAAGNRPSFDLVTGVSTGALTAPFAFVGPDQDRALRSVYTEVTLADIARTRYFTAALLNDGMADTLPLLATISRFLNEALMAEIARGYRQGRLLLIGTTDLDAQLPVIWNFGAIAASGHPRALPLLRQILVASAAIPGAFPPQMIDVTLNGTPHQELHVDGGAINQAFLYPPALTAQRREQIRRGQAVRQGRVFVIRNARLDPQWAEVNRRTLSITGRAISTMLAASGYNDLVRIWNSAQRDQLDFNMAAIGDDFVEPFIEPFGQVYMRALFENGFAKARAGYNWAKEPPFVNAPVPAPQRRGA